MIRNTVNLYNEMREHTQMNLSRDAIRELRSYLIAELEAITRDLERIARMKKRHTIMKDDVVLYFSLKKNGWSYKE